MDTNIYSGDLVRLAAEDNESMAEEIAKWQLDSEYLRLLDADPARLWSVKKVKEWLDKDLEKPLNDFFFSVRTLDGDKLIGFVGLFGLQWNHGNVMVGLGIGDRELWGKGYGTDVMRLILRYAFTELNVFRVTLNVFEYNPRAIRSYEKAGFKVEGRMREFLHRDGRRWDLLYMGVLKDEWEQNGNRSNHKA